MCGCLCATVSFRPQVRYNLFIAALEECSKDNLDFVKDKSIKVSSGVMRVKHRCPAVCACKPARGMHVGMHE